MKNYDPVMSFGEDVAKRYPERGDEQETVDFMASLAGSGPVLELAVGTGRIALRLAERDLQVDGIDFSQAMIDELRANASGDQVSVTLGNYADVPVAGRYPLIYLVANTLSNLLTQEEQIGCFQNVADHLTSSGAFVVEGAATHAFFARLWLRNSQYVEVEGLGTDRVALDVLRHDPIRQILEENHVSLSSQGIRFNPIVTRYAWPSEMDLMARMAGLRLVERWGGWSREPFDAMSTNCISVYRPQDQ